MKGFISRVVAWLLGFQTLPTATEQITSVLSTFPSMVAKLDAGVAQAQDEITASYERQDEAYDDYLSTADRETDLRATLEDVEAKGRRASERISNMIGGAL